MNHNTEPHGNQRLPQGPRIRSCAGGWTLSAVNHVVLAGTVATEPKPRAGLDQPAVAFRLAVAREDDGSEPLHVDVVCMQHLAGFAFALVPGDHLGVAGRLDYHEWVAEDGIRRARWVVIARELIVLRHARRAA